MPNPKTQATVSDEHVDAVRRFNRFHTRLVGALGQRVLASPYSLPQTRVLYEIAHAPAGDPPVAGQLATRLGLDAGYLSRLLSGLQADGLLERAPAPGHARRQVLSLKPKGQRLVTKLEAASAGQVRGLLATLSVADQAALVGAMDRVRRLLGDAPDERLIVLRDAVPGDLGWIIHRQAVLYTREYGWDGSFETLVAEIVGQFGRSDQETARGRQRCWVAEREGEVIGSVFVVPKDELTAQLRLLYVDPSARGLGLGRRLVDECLRFARAAGYRRMVLWTNDVLVSARRIYQAAGFTLTEEERHHSFGKDLVGQYWGRDL
jgi:DNA-binding MarR family transcriptional regulator/N-acetylglutamate synthase-like GNAT family acetyltransferase